MHASATRRSVLPDPFPLSLNAIAGLLRNDCAVSEAVVTAGDQMISGLTRAHDADASALSFYEKARHSRPPSAGVCLVSGKCGDALQSWVVPVVVATPKDSFFTLVDFLYPGANRDDWSIAAALAPPRIADGAKVDKTAVIADGVVIGPHCVIGPNVTIGPGCYLGSGTVCEPNVVLSCTSTGQDVLIKSGSVIGSLGFGFYRNRRHDRTQPIPHLGGVVLGDAAQVGACVCIDRGVLSATTVGAGTLIGNHVQIGHNAEIGREVVIMSFCALGGSTRIADRARLCGGVKTVQYSVIGKDAIVLGATCVTRPVPAGQTHAGYYNLPSRLFHRMYNTLKKSAG